MRREQIREVLEQHRNSAMTVEALLDAIASIDCTCARGPSFEGPDEMCPVDGRYTFADLTQMVLDIHQITIGNRPAPVDLADTPDIVLLTELTNRRMLAEAETVREEAGLPTVEGTPPQPQPVRPRPILPPPPPVAPHSEEGPPF